MVNRVSFELAETRRLAALLALNLLDTAPEQEFDALARLAGAATGCPTALVSLIDRDRLWVKAAIGDVPPEVPRAMAFCDTTIREDRAIVVENLTLDPRFSHLPFVTEGSRFYTGLPLRVVDGDGMRQPIGTLCVLDSEPRRLSEEQRSALDDLAALAEALIASRGAAREAVGHAVGVERQHRLFRQAERMAKIGWWRLTLDDDRVEWSEGVYRIHDVAIGTDPSLSSGLDFYPPQSRAVVTRALTHTIETGEPFDYEVDFLSAKGIARRVRAMGELERADDRPVAVIGVFRDVSDEYALSQALRRSADTDPLTDMANRAAFNRRLERAIVSAREEARPLALVLIDLDGFKRINDTFGHPAGDDVLRTVARRLHAPWLQHCCAARLGGDEFALIVDDPALLADDAALVARLEDELRVATTVAGLTMETGASVGVTRFDCSRFTALQDFMHEADARLYVAKRHRVGERRAA